MTLSRHIYVRFTSWQCIVCISALLCACAVKPAGSFVKGDVPRVPDYSHRQSWAALPSRMDSADVVPVDTMAPRQSVARADVFYIYPTTYTGRRGHRDWNARVDDAELNERTDRTAVRHQASIFNAAGRVFAPRYRQAHLHAFFTKTRKDDAQAALEVAYTDVRNAFAYYLKHYNAGRPVIIAGHSQGAYHGARLLKEYFDGTELSAKLIVAYLVGMPIRPGNFEELNACQSAEDTQCICSWRTVREGTFPGRFYKPDSTVIVTNPLSWETSTELADRDQHNGAVLKDFYNSVVPQYVSAQVHQGLLWISKPKIPWVPVFLIRNYHIADFNFFYVNVRENAQLRVEAYFRKSS